MHAWLIPYKPTMYIQFRLNQAEAVELLKEMEGFDEESKLKELLDKLEEIVTRAKQIEL